MENKKAIVTTVTTASLKPGVPTKRTQNNSLKPYRASELPNADEPITYLIDDFMEHATFNSLVGASKSGKSMLALQMAFCIQNGIPFLGHDVDQGDVLYLDFELKSNHIKQRVNAVKRYYNLPLGDDPIYLSLYEDFSSGRVDFEDVITQARDILGKNPNIKLVIADCFYSWAKGARNEEGNVMAQLQPLKTLSKDYDVAVMYVHHTSKSGIKKDPDTNDIINAAGGSGVHGKIVDQTYVVYPVGRSKTMFMIASAGRSNGCSDTLCEKSAATEYFFNSYAEETQEVNDVDSGLCRAIAEYIDSTGTVDLRSIQSKFAVTNETLRDMGFGIDPKTHRIYMDKSKLCFTTMEDDDENCVAGDVDLTA